jgi:carbamoyltransferase
MYILGVNISHQPSTALFKDGELLWYIENERISKIKDYCLDEELNTRELISDCVDHLIIASFGSPMYDPKRIENVKNSVPHKNIYYDMYTHHKYHASNAFYDSGFEECVAIVMDGYGAQRDSIHMNREIESTYLCSYPDNIVPVEKHYSVCDLNGTRQSFIIDNDVMSDGFSCGYMFLETCNKFGMNSGLNAGKIMGMAAYGSPSTKNPWFIDGIADNQVFLSELENVSTFEEKCNFAWKLQEETKRHTINYISTVIKKYQPKNIVLSGGYFLNCVNNYFYLKEFPQINFYIDPIAHDGGTALGAAKVLWHSMTKDMTIRKIKNLYYGPSYDSWETVTGG